MGKRRSRKAVSLAGTATVTGEPYDRRSTDLPIAMAGMLSVAEVERRILRACMTLRALPDPERRFQWLRGCWPEVVRSTEEAYGYADATVRAFRPTPADVSDLLVALSWVRGMPWDEYRMIWWRSFDVSFRQMAMRIHRSDETARAWYRDALLKVWYEANRQKDAGQRRAS